MASSMQSMLRRHPEALLTVQVSTIAECKPFSGPLLESAAVRIQKAFRYFNRRCPSCPDIIVARPQPLTACISPEDDLDSLVGSSAADMVLPTPRHQPSCARLLPSQIATIGIPAGQFASLLSHGSHPSTGRLAAQQNPGRCTTSQPDCLVWA
jgi:hypothetical protein